MDIKVAGRSLEDWGEQLRIDTDGLDHEIETQPFLFYQVASAYAQAVSQRDEAYDYVRQVDAGLNFKVREEMANNGQRVTEEQVKSAIQIHQEHLNAYQAYLEKKQQAEEIEALRSALQQRGYMLRDLAQLYTTGYMSSTSAGGQTSYSREAPVDEHNRARLRRGLSRTGEE